MKQKIIDKIFELSAYNDIEVAQKFVNCISEIWIDNQFEEFKFIVDDLNTEWVYIIHSEANEVYLQSFGKFCQAMIEDVEEYYDNKGLNFDKILKINL